MSIQVKTKNITALDIACFITLFGSSFIFIPLGREYTNWFGPAVSWSLIYIIYRLPNLVFSDLISRVGNKLGLNATIKSSLVLAGVSSLIMYIGVSRGYHVVTFAGFLLVSTFSKVLSSLYPALLNFNSKKLNEVQSSMSNWTIIVYGAFIAGTACGGFVADLMSIKVFVLVDAITFFVAALIWHLAKPENIVSGHSNNQNEQFKILAIKDYIAVVFDPLSLSIFFKKVIYGFFNPLLPILMFDTFKQSSSRLGILYTVSSIGVILGAIISKKIQATARVSLIVGIIEVVFIVCTLVTGQVELFWIFCFISMIFGSQYDVYSQTIFFNQFDKSMTAYASNIFLALQNGGLILGYLLFMGFSVFENFNYNSMTIVVCAVLFVALMWNRKENEKFKLCPAEI